MLASEAAQSSLIVLVRKASSVSGMEPLPLRGEQSDGDKAHNWFLSPPSLSCLPQFRRICIPATDRFKLFMFCLSLQEFLK